MFDRTASFPHESTVDQLDDHPTYAQLSIVQVTSLVEQLLESAATRPQAGCPVRASLIQVISDFDAGWDDYASMSSWLMRASADLGHSAGSTRLTQRRAYRCAEEAFRLAIDLLSLDTTGRQPLDVSSLIQCGRIANQASALKAHKALKRLLRKQLVGGWHALVVDTALGAIGNARMAANASAAAPRLGQLVSLAEAVAADRPTAAARLRRRLTDLEREIAGMVEDMDDEPMFGLAAA